MWLCVRLHMCTWLRRRIYRQIRPLSPAEVENPLKILDPSDPLKPLLATQIEIGTRPAADDTCAPSNLGSAQGHPQSWTVPVDAREMIAIGISLGQELELWP